MLVAIFIGVILGVLIPQKVLFVDNIIKFLTDLSINLLLYLTLLYVLVKLFLGVLHLKKSKKNYIKIFIVFFIGIVVSLIFSIIVSMGLMNLNIFKPDQIAQYETKPLKIYGFSELLLNIMNSNIFTSFEGQFKFILPVVFVGLLFGLASANLSKRSYIFVEMIEAFDIILSKVSRQLLELYPFFSIFTVMSLIRLNLFSEDKLQFILKPFLGILLISAILLIFYTIFLYIIFKEKMPKFYLGILGAALASFVAGNTAASIIPLNEHLKKNIGVKKEISNSLVPIGMVFNKSGTIVISAVSLISIILYFTPSILNFKLQFLIFFLLFIFSFSLDGVNEGGFLVVVAAIMGINTLHLEDNTYLLFLPFIPILSRVGIFLDVISTAIFVSLTSKFVENIEIKEYIDFI